MKIITANPTPYFREQRVLFGSAEAHNPVHKLPRTWLNVVNVRVPPWHIGEVEADDDTPKRFAFHRTVRPIQPFIRINGVPLAMQWKRRLVSSTSLLVDLWTARSEKGIARLVTYFFHDSPVARFELQCYCESKNSPLQAMSFVFNVKGENLIVAQRFARPQLMSNEPMLDGQGKRFVGSLLFFGTESSVSDFSTVMAEYEYPLHGLDDWRWWGPWKKAPFALNNKFLIKSLTSKLGKRWTELFQWPGYLLNRGPGDSGAQPGFGTWQHLDCIATKSALPMHMNQLIAAQEDCRPVYYFEKDAEPMRSKAHPDYTSWNEWPHWNKVVSKDRLGRTHGYGNLPKLSWYGHDRQHYGCIWLAEDCILNGSFASALSLEQKGENLLAGMTLPSQKPNHPTNTRGAARGIGRAFLGMTYNYLATGDKRILDRAEARLMETIVPKWNGRKGKGPIYPDALITNDPRVFANGTGWIVWEDALMVMGLDAFAGVLRDAKRTRAADAAYEIIRKMAFSVTLYGWHPKRNIIAKAVRWNGSAQPIKAADWDNKSMVSLASGTDYGHWAHPCLTIAKRMATLGSRDDVVARAHELLLSLGDQHAHKDRHTYLGAQ